MVSKSPLITPWQNAQNVKYGSLNFYLGRYLKNRSTIICEKSRLYRPTALTLLMLISFYTNNNNTGYIKTVILKPLFWPQVAHKRIVIILAIVNSNFIYNIGLLLV